eukprot:CAMPEP_0198141670 /NCGR_PEP_ID=MMETSP1443-20131203/4632_1 /TAXON_ID=186043 /ORGANISM="Entomoneis sp., Strain CCMP2396" /LENGTH=188 /DNA_ID=CAMNT_0043804479 /DNA_START=48 /DNA_END=614 /DNA_ORIENTATION=-
MMRFFLFILILSVASFAQGFAPFSPATSVVPNRVSSHKNGFLKQQLLNNNAQVVMLKSPTDDSEEEVSTLGIFDQRAIGIAGTVSALIVFVSEYTLATTGCGLPAGPFGFFGLAEGLSYLGVVGLAGYATFTKIKTGSGLPAGPAGLLGAAEGLSFLSILVGLVVLGLQVTNYGYIPNAVPMEGGMCS